MRSCFSRRTPPSPPALPSNEATAYTARAGSMRYMAVARALRYLRACVSMQVCQAASGRWLMRQEVCCVSRCEMQHRLTCSR